MKKLASAYALIAALLSVCSPSHAQAVFSAKAESFDGSHSVEFDGTGWRSLRLITLVTTVAGLNLPQQAYLACGTGKFFIPNLYAPPKAHEVYADKQSSDLIVSLGGTRDANSKEFVFDLPASDDRRLAQAMNRVCEAPIVREEQPTDIFVATSNGRFFDILPETFSRSGSQISLSMRSRWYREEVGKAGLFDRDFRIVVAHRGYEVSKVKIDCSTQSLVPLSVSSHNSKGNVVGSRSAPPSGSTSAEAPPGSVAEDMIRVACMIK